MSYYITNQEYSRIQSYMRLVFTQSGYVNEFKRSKRSKKVGNKYLYKCDICNESFGVSQVQVHHLNECIPIGVHYSNVPMDEFFKRLWCPIEELQMVCKSCHQLESNLQNIERRK